MTNKLLYIIFMFNFCFLQAQEEDKEEVLQASNNFIYDGNEELAKNNFVEAEATYRKAISKNSENANAKYNLGNAYYKENSLTEAFSRYKQAGEVALTKEQKHKANHNMGNVFMKNKEYEKAVETYKEALRSIPSDEETRYNLALAKEMLKKQQEEQQQNDKNKDDKNKDQENKDEKDQKDQKDKEDKGEDEGDQKDKNKDEGENEDEGDKKEEDKKEGEGDKKEDEGDQKDKNNEGNEKEDKNAQQQSRPNQMSPQQIKNMLKAIEDEEKKVQEKVNAQKVKGKKVNTDKDW